MHHLRVSAIDPRKVVYSDWDMGTTAAGPRMCVSHRIDRRVRLNSLVRYTTLEVWLFDCRSFFRCSFASIFCYFEHIGSSFLSKLALQILVPVDF